MKHSALMFLENTLGGVENANGTYKSTINENSKVENYSPDSAPIVCLFTEGYSASKTPTSYNANEVNNYADAGFIYYNPRFRGRDTSRLKVAPSGYC